MRNARFYLAWVFILLAAAYDAYFAWHYRGVFQVWEMNPLARWTGGTLGLHVLLSFKCAGMVFAAGLALYCHWRRLWHEKPLTLIVGCAYMALSVHYFVGHVQPPGPYSEQWAVGSGQWAVKQNPGRLP